MPVEVVMRQNCAGERKEGVGNEATMRAAIVEALRDLADKIEANCPDDAAELEELANEIEAGG